MLMTSKIILSKITLNNSYVDNKSYGQTTVDPAICPESIDLDTP